VRVCPFDREILRKPIPELDYPRHFWKGVLSSAFLTGIMTLGGAWLIKNKTNLILERERQEQRPPRKT
jgi:hypothetical protein